MSLSTPIDTTLEIKCKCCGQKDFYNITIDDLNWQGSYERGMGEEIQYDFETELTCQHCNEDFEVTIDIWEYPVGVLSLIEPSI